MKLLGRSTPAVSGADMRNFLRVASASPEEDDLILALIEAASDCVQQESGLVLTEELWQTTVVGPGNWHSCPGMAGPSLALPRGPVSTLVSSLVSEDGINYVEGGLLDYQLMPSTMPPVVIAATGSPAFGVRITYKAGTLYPIDVPAPLLHAVRMLVADWYMHREDSDATKPQRVPNGFRQMCASARLDWRT